MRGRAGAAQRLLAQTVDDVFATRHPRVAPATGLSAAFLVEACALTRDAEGAQRTAAYAESAAEDVALFEGVMLRSRTWLALARGQMTCAVQLAMDAADWSRTHRQFTVELFALHDAVRIGHGALALPRLTVLAAETEMRWANLFLQHANAEAGDDGPALEAVATTFEQDGAFLRAAEAAAQAAAAHHRHGLDARAARWHARTQVLLAHCDGARPIHLTSVDEPIPLTRREREVALLAAEGLTSRAIGERLPCSVHIPSSGSTTVPVSRARSVKTGSHLLAFAT
jgi:hypothetical protein